jgi:hypothetical protein
VETESRRVDPADINTYLHRDSILTPPDDARESRPPQITSSHSTSSISILFYRSLFPSTFFVTARSKPLHPPLTKCQQPAKPDTLKGKIKMVFEFPRAIPLSRLSSSALNAENAMQSTSNKTPDPPISRLMKEKKVLLRHRCLVRDRRLARIRWRTQIYDLRIRIVDL